MNAAIAIPEVFTFQESHKVRTTLQNNELWFVAKDVFSVLGVYWAGVRSLSMIPEAWRLVVSFTTKLKNQNGELGERVNDTHVINFKGLCKIAFRSNKPEADAFTNWAAEVIDTVMKTGSYVLPTAKAAIETITPTQYHNLRVMVNDIADSFHFKGSWEHWAWRHIRALSNGEVAAKLPATMYDQAVTVLKALEVDASLFLSQQRDREKEFLRQDRNLLTQRVQMLLPIN